MPIAMTPPSPLVLSGQGAGGKVFNVQPSTGTAMVDDDSVASLQAAGWKLPGVSVKAPGSYQQPYVLAQSGVPIILPSSGSSNASGQITLTTALPYQPSGTVLTYLPAGVVTGGSAGTGAGLYPVVYSSTTVGQIQGNGIVTANGAYTQTTGADIALVSVQLPGGAMGPNGSLRQHMEINAPINANNKTCQFKLAGQGISGGTLTFAQAGSMGRWFRNKGDQAKNVWVASSGQFPSEGSVATAVQTSIDTSVTQTWSITANLAVATDYILVEGYTVEVLPGT